MKKIISVLLLTFAVMMLSSCLWVINSDDITTNYYDITCYNASNKDITDWCVVKDGHRTYANSTKCSPIPKKSGSTLSSSTISNIPEGNYILYVSFVPNPDYEKGQYIESKTIKLSGRDYEVYVDQSWVDEYFN